MNAYYFGDPAHPIVGVFHAARGNKRDRHRTIVICPPIGQEYIRTHWCLRLLARQLSRKGISVLRFDYRGIGDSYGSTDEVTDVAIWRNDIRAAIEFAKTNTGCDDVILLGLRFGASLAADVAAESNDVSGLMLWEPVTDGQHYLQTLRSMHREMLDLWVCKIKTQNDQQQEEILGSIYRRELLDQIESFKTNLSAIQQPQFIVDLFQRRDHYQLNPLQKLMPVNDENTWNDLRHLETGWLRSATSRQLALMAGEMFDRLQRRQPSQPQTTNDAAESALWKVRVAPRIPALPTTTLSPQPL